MWKKITGSKITLILEFIVLLLVILAVLEVFRYYLWGLMID